MRRTLVIPMLLVAATAAAETPVRVVSDDLRVRSLVLGEMDETGAVFRDDDSRRTRVTAGSLLAVTVARAPRTLPEFPVLSTGSRVFVELIDGQRLAVEVGPTEALDTLSGLAVGFGPARIPLERVARIARPGAPWHAATPDTDTVLLTNGDRLTGFVEAIGPVVTIDTGRGASSSVPLDRVMEVLLANPAVPAPGPLATDDQGVALHAVTLRVDAAGRMELTTRPGPIGIDSRGEDTLVYDRPPARLLGFRAADTRPVLALSAIEPTGARPTGDRRWTPAPVRQPGEDAVLPIGHVLMPAPAEAIYPLVSAAGRPARFACTVRAATPGDWTDCVAGVHAELADGSRVLLGEHRLTASSPTGEIASDLPPGTRALVLTVDPGLHGAVQDAVLFDTPRVLFAP